jgi:hypothetical protein
MDFWTALYVVYVLCLVFEQLLLLKLSQQLGLDQRQHVLLVAVVRMRAAAAA